ncbi:unnamed protein product [Phaeothamnion confervicola]
MPGFDFFSPFFSTVAADRWIFKGGKRDGCGNGLQATGIWWRVSGRSAAYVRQRRHAWLDRQCSSAFWSRLSRMCRRRPCVASSPPSEPQTGFPSDSPGCG